MATTREEISEWFDEGVRQGATHMVVVCDTFAYEDYPVYVKPTENVYDVYDKNGGDKGENDNMQRVMEVYDLRADKAEQVNATRTKNFGTAVRYPDECTG